jgi:hypothetical protein
MANVKTEVSVVGFGVYLQTDRNPADVDLDWKSGKVVDGA